MFFFLQGGPLQVIDGVMTPIKQGYNTSYPFQRPFFLVKFPGERPKDSWRVVGCKCNTHPLILCQGALRVLCCVHQADFFGYVEYGQFVIFTSIVLENICHHFSFSSTDQPPEKEIS